MPHKKVTKKYAPTKSPSHGISIITFPLQNTIITAPVDSGPSKKVNKIEAVGFRLYRRFFRFTPRAVLGRQNLAILKTIRREVNLFLLTLLELVGILFGSP